MPDSFSINGKITAAFVVVLVVVLVVPILVVNFLISMFVCVSIFTLFGLVSAIRRKQVGRAERRPELFDKVPAAAVLVFGTQKPSSAKPVFSAKGPKAVGSTSQQ
ncbi:hypothetical protein F5876DRAFT_65308 [Lentinula aff. lateritia]|uniref:Uncharacterized protein n=1 Tax=Lentinula aff. lateritia TaxID=2804960 RepID=A0ACC1U287_9AGAR|nr:hypothetical protein F5876DRAFT_65308 [Lentinula aff. lateritia]